MGLFLTFGIVIVIIALMTITTVIDVRARRSDVREAMLQTAQDFATIADGVLPDAFVSGDLRELNNFAAALWAQRDTSYVKIFDREGRLLVGPGVDQYSMGVQDKSVPRQVMDLSTVRRWNDHGLEVIAPVTNGAQLVGAVQFGFDTARINDEIVSLTMSRIWQTLALVCLGILGSYLLANYFVRPIRMLVRATERLAAGDLATRVDELHGREMRNLGKSFNSMAVELQDKVVALNESRTRIVAGEERVRREIASHLHGPVQGRLLALRAQLDQAIHVEGMPLSAQSSLQGIVKNMGEVIQSEIATLSRRLYPAIVLRGLVAAMQSLCDQFEQSLALKLVFADNLTSGGQGSIALVPERTRLAAYRIANEALTNAVKYAAGADVLVQLETTPDGWLLLTIQDTGPGFEPETSTAGMGLATMSDYAEAIGGVCTIRSSPGKGTVVNALLPMWDEGEQAPGMP